MTGSDEEKGRFMFPPGVEVRTSLTHAEIITLRTEVERAEALAKFMGSQYPDQVRRLDALVAESEDVVAEGYSARLGTALRQIVDIAVMYQ
jgi:hypothetical protein